MRFNEMVGFGGILVVALVGFLYAWFSDPPKKAKRPR